MRNAEKTSLSHSPIRIQHSIITFLATSIVPYCAAASPPELIECDYLYELAGSATVSVLPPQLRSFFEIRLEALQAAAAPGAMMSKGSKHSIGEEQWHYVSLDAAVGAASPEERRAAARRFPRERDRALALYERHGLREGGILPWIVQERYEATVRAFRSGESKKIVAETGVLLHFSVDAAMPFNTAVKPGRQQLDQTNLLHSLKNRLEYEVRVSPDRLAPVHDVIETTFDVLLGAHRAAVEWNAISDAASPAARGSSAEKLAEQAAPILETQIESGALLAANLIAAAWSEAGKPDLTTAAVVVPAPPATTPRVSSAVFVGSRNSTVYHRPDCPHAARIKLENRVTYETQELVRAAARTPCKSCKPDVPAKP